MQGLFTGTEWLFYHFQTTIRQLDIVLTYENVHAVISVVRSNIMLGIVPLYLVQSAIYLKELALIRVEKDEVRSRISLLRLAGRKPGVS